MCNNVLLAKFCDMKDKFNEPTAHCSFFIDFIVTASSAKSKASEKHKILFLYFWSPLRFGFIYTNSKVKTFLLQALKIYTEQRYRVFRISSVNTQ